MSTKTDPAITRDRVEDRAKRLYESGYRAAAIPERPCILLMISPLGDPYTIDLAGKTCNCAYFPLHGYCKHVLGAPTLLRAQQSAKSRNSKFDAERAQADIWREEWAQVRNFDDLQQLRRSQREEDAAWNARFAPTAQQTPEATGYGVEERAQ